MKKISLMPQILSFALFFLLISAQAETKYDYKTGTWYTSSSTYNGTTVKARNSRTGSTWTTTYEDNGNMKGTDSKGNRWTYKKSTGTYHNYGTGEYRKKGKCYYNCD